MRKGLRITIITVLSLTIILVGGFYIYTLDYYRADDTAEQILSDYSANIDTEGKITVFYPEKQNDLNKGFIFYPGGKVEAIAYAPLLHQLSNEGFTCFLIEMPFNLAVFKINAADGVYKKYPDIGEWYLGGHSLGGAMASSYAGKNSEKMEGLVLLGAYPVNDSDIPTIAIYGSEDKLNRTKLDSTDTNIEIEGGNHAYVGNYGEQKGDGEASISREQQQSIIIKAITDFMN